MDLLDIGGGFPGSDDSRLTFEEVSSIFMVAVIYEINSTIFF